MLVEITGKRYEEVLTVSTRQIAEDFEKTHREVIYAIEGRTSDTERAEGLEVKNKGIIPMLIQGGNPHVENYFIGSEYVGENGRKYKEYLVTRDGFSLLAMGFTGEKALKWKLKYIEQMKMFTKEIVFLLLVLSKVGFDIVIFTPGGVNCVENIINSQIVDIHRLDVINYNLKYKSNNYNTNTSSNRNGGSWIERIFGKWSD